MDLNQFLSVVFQKRTIGIFRLIFVTESLKLERVKYILFTRKNCSKPFHFLSEPFHFFLLMCKWALLLNISCFGLKAAGRLEQVKVLYP